MIKYPDTPPPERELTEVAAGPSVRPVVGVEMDGGYCCALQPGLLAR
jgi:hypothetical protein